MNIIAKFKHNGQNQRQLVTFENRTYRRIEGIIYRDKFEKLASPNWQEQIHNGDFHNIINSETVAKLEAEFLKINN